MIFTMTDSSPNTTSSSAQTVPYLGQPRRDKIGKKTLALDLDETLVRSSTAEPSSYDFTMEVTVKSVNQTIYVQARPGLCNFLVEMNKHYEIVLFTSCVPFYGNFVLDVLDPTSLCVTRLYREHCIR